MAWDILEPWVMGAIGGLASALITGKMSLIMPHLYREEIPIGVGEDGRPRIKQGPLKFHLGFLGDMAIGAIAGWAAVQVLELGADKLKVGATLAGIGGSSFLIRLKETLFGEEEIVAMAAREVDRADEVVRRTAESVSTIERLLARERESDEAGTKAPES